VFAVGSNCVGLGCVVWFLREIVGMRLRCTLLRQSLVSSRRAVPGRSLRTGKWSVWLAAAAGAQTGRLSGSQARRAARRNKSGRRQRANGTGGPSGGRRWERESQRAGCAEDGKAPKSSTTEAENGQIRLSPAKGTQPCLYPPMAGAGGCWLATPRSSGQRSARYCFIVGSREVPSTFAR
jgi:hypothetical protein